MSGTSRWLAMGVGALLMLGCEGFGGGSGSGSSGSTFSGPYTNCQFAYDMEDSSKAPFGAGCTTDADCAYGACIQPGSTGNITNDQFGFCTRACDCNEDTTSRLSEEEKAKYECIYPSSPAQDYRHVVIECTSLADCTAVDSRWTECSTGTGTARKVCKALNE